MEITTIGIDLSKNVFQIHGVDQRGKKALKKQLKPLLNQRPIEFSAPPGGVGG